MKNFLAKSNPPETIQEHTNKLVENYSILNAIYPELKVNWDLVYLACLYHDLGKINEKFQVRIRTGKRIENEIPHGILSLSFLNPKRLLKQGFSKEEIKILAHSIAYHHERNLLYENDTLDNEISLLAKEIKDFIYGRIPELEVKKLSVRFYVKNDRIEQVSDKKLFFEYVLVKGLLNRLDYAASGGIEVEKQNNFLLDKMEILLSEWKNENSNADWNDLQRHMIYHRNDNIIAIAETGMGKTEAGLLWIGNQKGFFTLPLKTAINAMYDRISKKILKNSFEDKVGLLHSDTYSEYLNRDYIEGDIDEYFNKTKQLSLPLTICTLDQLFDFVFRYRGFELKLATLAYSKIVIDEVQMYSPDLLAYLILGLYYITQVGGKFAILTATLPKLVEDLLRAEGVNFVSPKTFTNNVRVRHSVKVIHSRMDVQEIISRYNHNKVLVICNTVKEAQRVYNELWKVFKPSVNLFHSGFINKDRKQKEIDILELGDKKSREYGIWVTTQVVEASLDIDFDLLFTELSDLNGLFQRFGRCYRTRKFTEEGYNCFVFDGGKRECNGVGIFIDREIFALSKDVLKNINGPLCEKKKMELVRNLYTIENLKNTLYYNKIKNTLEYVKSTMDFELDKKEVKKRFRNIKSQTVMPANVYIENRQEIEQYISILSEDSKLLSLEKKKELKIRKARARSCLMEFTVNVPCHQIKGNVNQLVINKYESIILFDCKYSEKLGIQYINKSKLIETQQLDNFY